MSNDKNKEVNLLNKGKYYIRWKKLVFIYY